jgi:hypothetical protein
MAFCDSYSSSYSSSNGIGISVSVSGGIATIKLSDGRIFQVPSTRGSVSTSSINGRLFITVDGNRFEITDQGLMPVSQPTPAPVVQQISSQITGDTVNVAKILSQVKEQVVSSGASPESIANAQYGIDLAIDRLQAAKEKLASTVAPVEEVQPVSEITPAPAKVGAEPISIVEVQPGGSPVQAEIPQVQEAGILSEKIFGIPSVLLLGGIALAFLATRKVKRPERGG